MQFCPVGPDGAVPGRAKEAEEAYLEALERDGAHPRALQSYALLLDRCGRSPLTLLPAAQGSIRSAPLTSARSRRQFEGPLSHRTRPTQPGHFL